jgi:hypothetical protein
MYKEIKKKTGRNTEREKGRGRHIIRLWSADIGTETERER